MALSLFASGVLDHVLPHTGRWASLCSMGPYLLKWGPLLYSVRNINFGQGPDVPSPEKSYPDRGESSDGQIHD